MIIFLDTEFTGLHQGASLISLALVTEYDQTFYAEFNDYDRMSLDPWIEENVIAHLEFNHLNEIYKTESGYTRMKGNSRQVVNELENFMSEFGKIVIWGDNHAYDWVLFCELWGGALNLPKLRNNPCEQQIDYLIRDLTTLLELKGIDPSISRHEFAELNLESGYIKHHALWDTIATKMCYEKLSNMK